MKKHENDRLWIDEVCQLLNKYLFKPKDANYDLIFSPKMISVEKIIEANNKLITKFIGNK